MLELNKFKYIFILFIIALMGCATTYHPLNLLGGYEDREISLNTYEIKFTGNQHTTGKIIRDYLLYRSAEITLQKQFTNFIILSDKSYSRKLINDAEKGEPYTHRVSLSGGHVTVVNPEFDVSTSSEDITGVYIITLFNENDPAFKIIKKTGYAAEKVINDLSSITK